MVVKSNKGGSVKYRIVGGELKHMGHTSPPPEHKTDPNAPVGTDNYALEGGMLENRGKTTVPRRLAYPEELTEE